MAEETQKQSSNQSNTNESSNASTEFSSPLGNQIIAKEEYNNLKPEEKDRYVLYNPAAYDEGVAALVQQANGQMEVLETLAPALEKVKVMPQPLPAEQLDKALDSLEKALKLIDPIKALTKVPIIGGLAQAVVNVLNSIIQLIGFALMIEFYIARGAPIFTDQIKKTWDQLDIEGIGDKIKKIKEAAEKKDEKKEINWDAFPTESIKKKVQELQDSVDATVGTLDVAKVGTRAMDITIDAVYAQMSWDVQFKHIQKTLGKLGLDLSPLNQPTDAQIKSFDKMIPNPQIQMNKLKRSIEAIDPPEEQYICIDEKKEMEQKQTKQTFIKKKPALSDRLTEHFILNDLCKSDTARKNRITNIPDEAGVEKLRFLANTILEPVYKKYGRICINSGYRGPRLNAIVGGAETSQHCKCEACDIEVMGVNNFALAEWIRANCEYDQIILEYASNLTNDPNSGWVHVSVKKSGNRHQCLSINKAGTFSGLQKVCYPK